MILIIFMLLFVLHRFDCLFFFFLFLSFNLQIVFQNSKEMWQVV